MDAELCNAVAKRIATWMDEAARFARNEDFYRQLLDQCAKNLGPLRARAFIQDDGGISDRPLRLKIPGLVAELSSNCSCIG